MKAEIIAVGTEILLGDIVNTDAQVISLGLDELGIDVYYQTVDGDKPERLRAVLARSLDEAVLLGLSMTMEQLRLKGQTVCRDSRAAYDFLRKKG